MKYKYIMIALMVCGMLPVLGGSCPSRDLQPQPGHTPDEPLKHTHPSSCKPSYQHIVESDPLPLSIHIVRANPAYCDLKIGSTSAAPRSGETVESIARRSDAIAAINGSAFPYPGNYFGLTKGYLRIDGFWQAIIPNIEAVIGWNDSSKIAFGRIGMYWHLDIAGQELPISNINSVRYKDGAVLFNQNIFKRPLAENPSLEIEIGPNYVVKKILPYSVNLKVPREGFVYSNGYLSAEELPYLKLGVSAIPYYRIVEFDSRKKYQSIAFTHDWQAQKNILGGISLAVKEGRAILQAPRLVKLPAVSRFVTQNFPLYEVPSTPNRGVLPPQSAVKIIPPIKISPPKSNVAISLGKSPRSGICTDKNGDVVFIMVEGRDDVRSMGMTFDEFAEFLVSIGCWNAVNLDGGGSSSLYFDGEMRGVPPPQSATNKNLPRSWRKVPNALLIVPKI